MEFRSLASSSAGNAYVVTAGDWPPLLIECGIRAQELRKGLGFGLSRVAGCLLSHEHGDHALAVRDVMRAGVDVHASEGTWDALEIDGHRANVLRPLEQAGIGPWRVMPFAAIHDAAEPLGFLVAGGGGKLLYLIDSAYSRFRFRGLTHIAVEANYSSEILRRNVASERIPAAHRNRVLRNHLSIERVVDLLRANDIRSVREIWLLHLSDDNSDEAAFRAAVRRATGKPVYVAPRGA